MRWISVTVNTTVQAEDLVSSAVLACGVTGVQIDDSVPPTAREMEAMHNDLLPETAPEGFSGSDRSARVIFYLRTADPSDREPDSVSGLKDDSYSIHDRIYSEEEIRQLLNDLSYRLEGLRQRSDIGPGTMELSSTSDSDWIDNWKQYYVPIVIENMLILPEWMDVPEEHSAAVRSGELTVVKLNPGTAFGTGSHETTKLAIQGLLRYMRKGDRLLDIGTGSGIIGLCALACGASEVVGTEIDSACIPSVEHNMRINGADSSRFTVEITNLLDPSCVFPHGTFPVITANILAPVIAALAAPGFADRFARRDGYFITSGLAAAREKEILDAFSRNPSWQVREILRMNDWISVIAQKVI